jgi:hypothetical protein
MTRVTRRIALAAIAQLSAAVPLVAYGMVSAAPNPATADDIETLASIAFDILPFDKIRPELYVRAAEAMLAGNTPVVEQGLAELRKVAGTTRWMDLGETRRVAALKSVEGSAFFAHIRSSVINTLFADPEVWKLVGYGGPAVQLGGYIKRGFDDIDWLPAAGWK